jgi:restriction system protein
MKVKPTDPKVFFGLLGAVGIIWVIVQVLQQVSRVSSAELGIVILICGVALVAFPVVRHLRRGASRRALYQKSQAIVAQHMGALTTRRPQLVTQDSYGKFQFEKWQKELDYFVTEHIGPRLTPPERAELQREGPTFVNWIDANVIAAMQSQPVFQAFSDSMTSTQFEHFCANELRQAGWNARVTKQSRDQGVDVVAVMGNLRVVIQCKLYGQPVGNKAVQEAVAGRGHERATHGAVVTNNEYTLAAKQLASTNGIFLLHYSHLRDLHSLLHKRQT